jgi:GTP-binding protein EngB required for normal cell division
MTDRRATAEGTTSPLRVIAESASNTGAGSIANEATALADRLAEGRFFVACVGQFKRGKSTLLNALIGQPLLPTGVVPVTSAVTVLRYGPSLTTRVQLLDGTIRPIDTASIADYVTETRNPGNAKGVAAVEVSVPSRLLETGLCLVDTPGLGSVFAANADVTRAFAPQIDAALVVIGADPPISADELALVEEMGSRLDALLIVVNKADKGSAADLHEAAAFAESIVTRRLGREVGPPLLVSAAERLAGSYSRDWTELEEELRALAGRSSHLLASAAARGAARLARALLRDIDEQRTALTKPLADSERRLNHLRSSIAGAGQALRELSARLGVEQAELSAVFSKTRHEFLAVATPGVMHTLDQRIDAERYRRGPAYRARAMDLALDVAAEAVLEWARGVESEADALYGRAMTRFADLANDFMANFASSSGEANDESTALIEERGFRAAGGFHFAMLLRLAGPGPVAWVLDWVRPRRLEIAAVKASAAEYVRHLMDTNSARVANDLNERVLESRRGLESEIRSRLSALVESASRALQRASQHKAAGEEAVRGRVEHLDSLRCDIERLLAVDKVEKGP